MYNEIDGSMFIEYSDIIYKLLKFRRVENTFHENLAAVVCEVYLWQWPISRCSSCAMDKIPT